MVKLGRRLGKDINAIIQSGFIYLFPRQGDGFKFFKQRSHTIKDQILKKIICDVF